MGDSRYKAIDKPKERRQIFDDFCRNVAEEQNRSKERKERQAAAAEAAFLALLDEAQAWIEEDQEAAGSALPALSIYLPICSGHLLGQSDTAARIVIRTLCHLLPHGIAVIYVCDPPG